MLGLLAGITSIVLWLFVLIGSAIGFGGVCGIAVIWSVFNSPMGGIMDVVVLQMLGEERDL